ncbi:hypothetical protein Tsubulata_021066 [Turnera subulata]|uniref:KIB1-4 beta-propeller domain-containing protein n=1 Tax=Turnera subulata TaxID=218843 RepID=A0A9Q0FK72_9ROSI|nr:hypothetical protein Tsubulata_021066 [Turnera subulata]
MLRYSSCLRNLHYKTSNYHYHLLSKNNIITIRTPAAAAASSASSCYSSLSAPNPSPLSSSDEKPILSQFPLLVFPSGSRYYRKGQPRHKASFRFFNPASNQFTGQLTSPLDNITQPAAYPVFSNRGWLAYVDYTDFSLFLVNVFSASPSQEEDIITLPSFKTFKRFNREEIEEIRRFPETVTVSFGKVALSSSPKEDNCVVMLWLGWELLGDWKSDDDYRPTRPAFAFCRIGDTRWTFLEREMTDEDGSTNDIVYSDKDKLFYALHDSGELEAFDLNNTSSPVSFKCPITHYPANECLSSVFEKVDVSSNVAYYADYLVESPQGELLMIDRHTVVLGESIHEYKCYRCRMMRKNTFCDAPYRSLYFRVYKLNMEKQIAEDCSLEGMAAFVGKNQSFCVSVEDHPGLSPNSIYFTDDFTKVMQYDCPHGGHDNGVYNLLTHTVSPLFQPFDFKRIRPAPMWVYPDPSS